MPKSRSFIKNVAIQLRSNYDFDNSPNTLSGNRNVGEDEIEIRKSNFFIGRRKQIRKFLDFLEKSENKNGVFLVTGYRGMGKTSFVNHVINKYQNNQKKEVVSINLTIAQNNPNELDILKQLISSIKDEYKKLLTGPEYIEGSENEKRIKNPYHSKTRKTIIKSLNNSKVGLYISLLTFLATVSIFIFPEKVADFFETPFASCPFLPLIIKAPFFVSIVAIFHYSINLLKKKRELEKSNIDEDDIYKKFVSLADRTFSTVSEDNSSNNKYDVELNGLKLALINNSPKKSKLHSIATAREIEYELRILISELMDKEIELIIIFDELDKVELVNPNASLYQDLSTFEKFNTDSNISNEARKRKQVVLNVISGLKNFFTTTKARFVFIAGREMFDASLADVADKQSALSSIFTYVFNIDSFLKEEDGFTADENNNATSLTHAIEEFLIFQLLNDDQYTPPENSEHRYRLNEYLINKYANVAVEERNKAIILLQSFITYLAYRSNGSPKKLIKAFHEFIEHKELDYNKENVITLYQDCPEGRESRLFLYFNFNNQCRIGYINYLYRPFLVQYGRAFKQYSDNALISIPYLFDHLIKFHPFAFSRSHLELVPEVLSTNKSPTIKYDLDQIISYLTNNHIRDTDIEMFEYKFYCKSLNEIVYLSRIFEEESAAFNFTLDENYPVKILLNDKIKELRSIFSKFYPETSERSQQIFSLAYHNGNLADMSFFDQEFDDAICNYSDAIRPISNLSMKKISLQDFVTLIKNKLKIGLCFEKISSYEESLTFYTDATQNVKDYVNCKIKPNVGDSDVNSEIPFSSSFNDLLQIILQCFIAKMYVQEKMGLEGITSRKVISALSTFLKIADYVSKPAGRNNLIIANALMHTGHLLYYKNTAVPTEADLGFYPDWLKKRIEIMQDSSKTEINEAVRRQPKLAYRFYLLALDEVMRSRDSLKLPIIAGSQNKGKLDELLYYSKSENKSLHHNYLNRLYEYLYSWDESFTSKHYKYIASLLSSIGDCILGMADLGTGSNSNNNISSANFKTLKINDLFNAGIINHACKEGKVAINLPRGKTKVSSDSEDFFLALYTNESKGFIVSDVIKCYYLSAKYFKKYGRISSASFQLRKILQLLKMLLGQSEDMDNSLIDNFIKFIDTTLVKPALELTDITSGRTKYHMLAKFKGMEVTPEYAQNNLANNPDTKEIFLLFGYIKLKLKGEDEKLDHLVNPYNSISSQFVRIMELEYYSKYLFLDLRNQCSSLKSIKDNKEKFGHYFYSMNEILRILKIYGLDYMVSFCFCAQIHFKTAKLLNQIYKVSDTGIKSILDDINNEHIGKKSMVSLDPVYHYAMAKDYYQKAISLHTAGGEYIKTVKYMIYLEDDFNENAYHYGAAFDRYLMTKDVFSQNIESCDEYLKAPLTL